MKTAQTFSNSNRSSIFLIFTFWIALWIGSPVQSLFAFEIFKPLEPSHPSCQTSCHQPENIKKARSHKTVNAECSSCHVGPQTGISPNPFKSKFPAILYEHQKPNRRVQTFRGPVRVGQTHGSSKQTSSTAKTPEGMAYVPGGEFIMGSNDRWDDESPEHINSTDAFYIDLMEVTNADFKQFVDATDQAPPFHWPDGNLPEEKENHPVTYVNWFDADNYCQWKGKRLPTEQEWEKAARGEDGYIYPWGNVWVLTKSNNPYKGSTGTEPVGSYPDGRSPYGLDDMSGNVWEWVDSFYLPHPGNTTPKPEYGTDKRVLKGGSWFDCLSYGCGLSAPSFNRAFFNPEVRNNSFGFRCALSVDTKIQHKTEAKP